MEKHLPGIRTPAVCTIQAPCKINLHLAIGERRPDGFHDLESLFVTLALGDTLRFEHSAEKGAYLRFSGHLLVVPAQEIPPEKNLVTRAVSLFRERTGFSTGLSIRLDKRVPVGAGLGGGSSDAASTLLALNAFSGAALSMDELGEMAAILGSDVPFFLSGGAAFVSGRGEKIEPVSVPRGLWVILLMPPFASDTASAFRLLDEARAHGKKEVTPGSGGQGISKEALIRALEGDPANWPFRNDFLTVFLDSSLSPDAGHEARAGVYRALLEQLRQAGASFAGLSGSGSCCFGVFSSKETAEKAEKALAGQGNYVRLTFFLAQIHNAVLKYNI